MTREDVEKVAEPQELSAEAEKAVDVPAQVEGEPKLPYSKARLVTLVLAVTGAAFLNVSLVSMPLSFLS